MAEIRYVSATEAEQLIEQALVYLRAVCWTEWVASCHLHCSDFPDARASAELSKMDTALWLLCGESYRDQIKRERITVR